MEERVPPATTDTREDLLDTTPQRPPPSPPPPRPPPHRRGGHGGHDTFGSGTNVVQVSFGSGTYVVQVPKDQIYRIPPPENAEYVQRHQSNQSQQKRSFPSCSCLLYPFLILALIAFVLLLIVGIFYFTLKPEDVKFSIDQNIVAVPSKPKYIINLKAENPNKRTGVDYLKGGDASLSFKQQKIFTGDPPGFSTEPSTSTRIQLVLLGVEGKLPSEVQKSMKGKGNSIALSLSINIPVKMVIGFLSTWAMNSEITCDLRVNTLAKGTRVLSQECHTKVKIF